MAPMRSGLGPACGATWNWLMHPVWPWAAWSHGTPFTQISIAPGKCPVSAQTAGCVRVVYSPTTCSQRPGRSSPHGGCQSAPEPKPADGLNTYAESRSQRAAAVAAES